MHDSKILTLLWDREENAIDALQQAYGKLIYHIAFGIVGIRQDAQECENDTYLAIWNAIPPQRPEPLSPFVCKVSRNIAINRLRADSAQKRCCKHDIPLQELEEIIPGPCMEERVSAHVLGQAISAFLDTQSRESRILFLRRYWFGDTVQEAAKHLGITANAASVRLFRIREELKAYLLREELYYE